MIDSKGVNLSGTHTLTTQVIIDILETFPNVIRLTLLDTNISNEEIMHLLSIQPKLFYHLHDLIHPALLVRQASSPAPSPSPQSITIIQTDRSGNSYKYLSGLRIDTETRSFPEQYIDGQLGPVMALSSSTSLTPPHALPPAFPDDSNDRLRWMQRTGTYGKLGEEGWVFVLDYITMVQLVQLGCGPGVESDVGVGSCYGFLKVEAKAKEGTEEESTDADIAAMTLNTIKVHDIREFADAVEKEGRPRPSEEAIKAFEEAISATEVCIPFSGPPLTRTTVLRKTVEEVKRLGLFEMLSDSYESEIVPALGDGKRWFTVNDGVFNQVQGNQINNTTYTGFGGETVYEFVTRNAALNALHNSEQRFPHPNCLPGTRVEVLKDLHHWVIEKSSNTRVFWIHGPAGVGKSAIMQNVLERFARHYLAGSFFFSRSDTTRDRLDHFVPTILRQFHTSKPLNEVLGPMITEAIHSNPGIFQLSFEEQFQKLILDPCSRVDPKAWEKLPNLVVIDGLDECILIKSQERLISMIQEAIPNCPFRFLIASRPEPRIHRAFEHKMFTPHLSCLSIDNSPDSAQDIHTYFQHRFTQLNDTHPALCHLDVPWPGEENIQKLVQRACGQFIFAETVMKYLENDDELPTERLKAILRIRADSEDLPESAYPELDLLYHQILSNCPHWDDGPGQICFFHASFTEYLLNPTRSKDYYIQPHTESGYFDLVAQAFLHIISVRSQDYLQDLSKFPPMLPEEYKMHFSTLDLGKDFVSSLHEQIGDIMLNSYGSDIRSYHEPLFVILPLLCRLESPSAELLSALNHFDPYAFATWLLNWYQNSDVDSEKKDNYFQYWRPAIAWARSLGTRAPKTFIKNMESILSCYRIAAPSGTTNRQASVAVALLDDRFYVDIRHEDAWCMLHHAIDRDLPKFSVFYILWPDQTPPPSWLCYTITHQDLDKMLTKLLDSLFASTDLHGIDRDIGNDTYESVLDPAKHNDIYTMKKLIARHREQFGLPALPCTPPSIAQSHVEPANNIDPASRYSAGEGASRQERGLRRQASPTLSSQTPSRKRVRQGTSESGLQPTGDEEHTPTQESRSISAPTRGTRSSERIASKRNTPQDTGTSTLTRTARSTPTRKRQHKSAKIRGEQSTPTRGRRHTRRSG
ncbi:hypothetical protein VNI00_015857 [Paramarasmius palmivorus]|uniref:NACHT domain-containing protein n=1 Tax=Paramarasmius palmivorus TaxID=297713 RepID=A0AAW0BJC2_9AGAR